MAPLIERDVSHLQLIYQAVQLKLPRIHPKIQVPYLLHFQVQFLHVKSVLPLLTSLVPPGDDANNQSSLLPFLRSAIPSSLPPLRISNSAPVTPPLSSPTSGSLKRIPNWEVVAKESMASFSCPFYAVSAPASPTHRQFLAPATIPESDESDKSTVESGPWINFQKFAPSTSQVPTSPTFNLVKPLVSQSLPNNLIGEKGRGW